MIRECSRCIFAFLLLPVVAEFDPGLTVAEVSPVFGFLKTVYRLKDCATDSVASLATPSSLTIDAEVRNRS